MNNTELKERLDKAIIDGITLRGISNKSGINYNTLKWYRSNKDANFKEEKQQMLHAGLNYFNY